MIKYFSISKLQIYGSYYLDINQIKQIIVKQKQKICIPDFVAIILFLWQYGDFFLKVEKIEIKIFF